MQILQISDLHLRGDGRLSFRKVDTPAYLRVMADYLHALSPRTGRRSDYRRSGGQRRRARLPYAVRGMEPGSHSGHCPESMARWLDACLQEDAGRPALVFMHHPPFLTGMGVMDEPFDGAEPLHDEALARLCCGHMHRPIFTLWGDRPALTSPSVSMQIDLDLRPEGGDAFRMETPGYLLHLWDGARLNTHVCQIPAAADFSGPHPFADAVNPLED